MLDALGRVISEAPPDQWEARYTSVFVCKDEINLHFKKCFHLEAKIQKNQCILGDLANGCTINHHNVDLKNDRKTQEDACLLFSVLF